MGRPFLSAEEHERRGTVRPCRARTAPKKRRPRVVDASNTPRDFLGILDAYLAGVSSGSIVACRWTKLAVARFERMRASCIYDGSFIWSPSHVVAVYGFRKTPLASGVSEPAPRINGYPNIPDGGRLVTTVFFEVARKSAKSTLVAALALYHLLKEHEPGAQVITGASTGDQARIVFSIMQRMVKRSAWLRELGLLSWANAITSLDGNAKPINARSSTQDGLNPSFISLDESHAQDFGLHDVLKSAQGARNNPLLIAPTTAGYSLTSVGYALRQTAMKVLEGVIEAPHLFCVLYELDEGDHWDDERVWVKAAPMLGVTPTLEYVRQYRDDARATPGMEAEFQTKCCNRWLQSASTWLPMAAWARCADASSSLEDFEHEPCWIGVDLAERDDICAVALCFKREGLIHIFVRGYLPALVVAERARTVPEYRSWVQRGELMLTDGNLTDYGRIEADLRADGERFDVQEIVIEKFGALHLASNLATAGVPVRLEAKNAKVTTAPAKEFEARIKAGQLRHPGTSFLTWQVSNACVERRRDGSLLPTKDGPNSANKIDSVDAILLALSGMLTASTTPAAEPRIWFLEA
jgi:phage terminase large subunit-like protein